MEKMKRSKKTAARKAAEAEQNKANATSEKVEQEAKEDKAEQEPKGNETEQESKGNETEQEPKGNETEQLEDETPTTYSLSRLLGDDDDEDKNISVGLSDKQWEQFAALVQECDSKTTSARDQLNQAFGDEIAAYRKMVNQEKKLAKELDRLAEEDDPKKLTALRNGIVEKRAVLEELRVDYVEKRDKVRKLALRIADDSDNLKQELTTVSRWAFGIKAEPGSTTRGTSKSKSKGAKGTNGANGSTGDNTNGTEGTGDNTNGTEDTDGNSNGTEGTDGNTNGTEGTDGNSTGTEGTTGSVDGQTGNTMGEESKNVTGNESQEGSSMGNNGTYSGNEKPLNQDVKKAEGPVSKPDVDIEAARERLNLTLTRMVEMGALKVSRKEQHNLKPEDFICKNCGSTMVSNGYTHGWYSLELMPAQFVVVEHLVQAAVCEHCREIREDHKRTTTKAKPSKRLAARSYLTPTLAAWLATMWIYYGVTKYRMQVLTASMGFAMNSSVQGDLLEDLRCWITPMYELLKAEALKAPVLYVDETTWRTMQHLISGNRKESRIFAYVTDPKGGKSIRIYEYQPDRKADHITDFLDGYQYIIVTDGYQGYEKVANVVHCICYAHLRRKFLDAMPKGQAKKGCTARAGFDLCSYIISNEEFIEQQYGPMTAEERVEYRRTHTKPLVDKFFEWCKCVKKDNGGNAKLREAVNYALNHQQLLTNFLDHGEAQPTSNHVERALRPIANFRKICMHTGNDDSTQLMMMLASLLQTAAINNLNPQGYLELYLTRMLDFGEDVSEEKVAELIPWSTEMQESVKHLNLPVRKEKPWTESRLRKAGKHLREAMEIAYASSRTLRQTMPPAEWLDFHWSEDVLHPPRILPDPPKKVSKTKPSQAEKTADAV